MFLNGKTSQNELLLLGMKQIEGKVSLEQGKLVNGQCSVVFGDEERLLAFLVNFRIICEKHGS